MRDQFDSWLTSKLKVCPKATVLYWSLMYTISKPIEILAKKLHY